MKLEAVESVAHATSLDLDPALREEANFANTAYAPFMEDLRIHPEMFRKYRSPRELWDWRQMSALLLGDVAGKELLDYGCGMGEESIYLAKLGARVTSIDISEVGVECVQRRAAHHQLAIDAIQMRAERTDFPDASFDRIHGLGILHHIGIEVGLKEVRRLLRPGGIAVFLEPLGDSRVVEAVKTFLMKHARFLGEFEEVTDHEHNLRWAEIHAATRAFPEVALYPYHLLLRLKRFVPERLHDGVRRIDHALLTVAPGLQHFAGGVVMQLRG